MRTHAIRLRDGLLRLKRHCDARYGKLSSFIQFCFVGGTGVAVNLGALAVWLAVGVPPKFAYGLAIWVSMSSNFLLNRYLTFGHLERRPLLPQYLHYAASNALGSAVNWSVYAALLHASPFFAHHNIFAAIPGILAGTVFNFLISFHWVFRAHRPAAAQPAVSTDSNSSRPMGKKISTQ